MGSVIDLPFTGREGPPSNPNTPDVAEGGVELAVQDLRESRERLAETVSAKCEGGGGAPCTVRPCAGYDAIDEVLKVAQGAEAQLLAARERTAEDRARTAHLAAATLELAAIETTGGLVDAIPELALRVCPADGATLLRFARDGSVEVVARRGASFDARVTEEARAVVGGFTARPSGNSGNVAPPVELAPRLLERAVLIPLADGVERLVLALERTAQSPGIGERELERLVVFAALASSALTCVHSRAALREAAARDAATLSAIREGVLTIDRDGVVRALNGAAAGALGVRREELLGRRLRDAPGFAALGCALAAPPSQVMEVVSLPRGDIVLRSQRYDGGVVATFRDVATEQTIAHHMVGSVARYTFDQLVGAAPEFLRVLEVAERAACCDVPVLVCAESGTGKEMLAQAIHNASARASGPFIGINVTAIPRELLESELFGYEGGTFTGARASGRAGKFELAGRGTLLLDEIGDMPMEMQSKLLRVLQERVVQRLGSARDVQVRARIIATTSHDLGEAVERGRFRLDLYHRLRVLQLRLPPLRERKGDVPLLVEHQLRCHAERTHRRVDVAPHVMAALERYDWPGNVRELHNVLEGEISVLAPGERLLTRVPPVLLQRRAAPPPPVDKVLTLEEAERRACAHALVACDGNVTRAAQALGVAKGTLYSKIRKYGIVGDGPHGG